MTAMVCVRVNVAAVNDVCFMPSHRGAAAAGVDSWWSVLVVASLPVSIFKAPLIKFLSQPRNTLLILKPGGAASSLVVRYK